jgi:hypothetical protein
LSLFSDFRDALVGDDDVMAIALEVYRGIPSQEAPSPFIAYHVIGDNPLNSFEGEDDLQNRSIQVDCWASDLDTANSLESAVRVALYASELTLVRTGYRELYDGDSKLWRASSDWSTWSNG